jgi:hypothetical protein
MTVTPPTVARDSIAVLWFDRGSDTNRPINEVKRAARAS